MISRLSASLRLCVILFVAAPATADEPLVWKWAEGDTARYQMTQKMDMVMDAGPAGNVDVGTRVNMVLEWTVDSVADEGARLRQSHQRIVMRNEGPGGQVFTYDSQDEDPPAGMAALMAPMLEAMVEHDLIMTMKPNGETTDLELGDELAEAFDRLPGGAVNAEMVKQMTPQGMLTFPGEPLATGDTWTTETEVSAPQIGNLIVVIEFTYDGIREVDGHEYEAFTPYITAKTGGNEPPGVKVAIETTDSTGEVLFDREAGRLFRSRMLQTINVSVTVGERTIVNEIDQATELRLLADGEEPVIGLATESEESMAE